MIYKRITIKSFMFLFLFILLSLILVSCTEKKKQSDTYIEKTDFLLGTVVGVKIYGTEDEKIMSGSIEVLKEVENLMSTNNTKSDIYKINNSKVGEVVEVSTETSGLIEKSIEIMNLTQDTFNIKMGAIVDLWGIGTSNARVPETYEIEDELLNLEKSKLKLDGNKVTRLDSNFKIDLGAIAKGYAADKLAEYLKRNSINSAIINLGGNVYALGTKPSGKNFKVGIQNPLEERNNYFAIAEISDKTVVTSGNYERYFELDGKRYHHILDFKTGYPVENNLSSVTVITDSSTLADGLSTALYAMGIDKGLKLVDSLDNVKCVYVTKDKKLYFSDANWDDFIITNDEFIRAN